MRIQIADQGGGIRLYRHYGEAPGPLQTQSEGIDLVTANYDGHRFDDFYVSRDTSSAPGWFVFGRNAEKYGRRADGKGAYVMLCGRPDVPARRHPHYNGPVRRGWHRKCEAQAVADYLNAAAQAKAA